MQKVIVQNNQSLLDIAIQTTGIAMNFIKIASANGISPTDTITPGTTIQVPENLELNNDVVRCYLANGTVPTTAAGEIDSIVFKGIGSMEIGKSFVVR